MKVLKPGKDKGIWTIKHSCTGWGNGNEGCDAYLEIEKDDLMYFKGFVADYDLEGRDPKVSFQCPCCLAVTDLGRNDWPKGYHELPSWPKSWIYSADDKAA